ncbi:hypothetical protein [Bifidobacterium bifidum]|uniref:hypothetical protein n=1 Tax=Bifidobacterium bifidum TaxID=1681 RepID=UPI0001E6BCC4|nr:hypothetical protein [Bifidobacterium bifidum]ADO52517.1 conserved hypothetical protein [Bifidobacterium bifidum S17]
MKPHDMQPHASPGGMVLIRHLSAGSAGSASTMQPPSGNFGGCANTMQYDYSGSYSVSLTVGEDSTAVIDGTDITVSSSGSNGVFATDSGTALVNDTSIETMADNSRGLDATYGGTILANKITADTQGGHSAIVATDRGGGSISLADATLSTAGSGSPLLYSTGDIQVNNVSGTSSGSQIAGMEGLNTILIKDSTLESTVTGKTASDPIANGIIIYQSTSGGVTADTISSVDLYLLDGAAWIGAATITDNAAAGSGTGTASDAPITVNVDGTSTWGVAKDTTISALNVASGSDGNTVTIVANGKTVVSGSGDVTVTVTGSYSTSVSAGSDTELSSDTIDRSEFDSRFGTSTAWTMA